MKTDKRRPSLSEATVWEIIDDKSLFFVMKRMSLYKMNHFVYSEPVEGLKRFKTLYEWPTEIVHLCNIVRCLEEYYDFGYYEIDDVALFIHQLWGKDIKKHSSGVRAIPYFDNERISKEFRARGFVDKSTLYYDEEEDSWIESLHIKPILVHPELCWHKAEDKDLYDHYIYDFQGYVGIPGYTRARIAGLRRRK